MIMKTTRLLAATLLMPCLALADTLELPADARIEVHVIDTLQLDPETPRQDDILLSPVANGSGSHQLPEYCVMIGNARLDDERILVSTQALTCIETEGGESEIFSGEISAAAYESDGSYGVDACRDSRCSLPPERGFELRLASPVEIEEQENPAARLNEQRRQADGEGVPPAERPEPAQ